MDQQEYVSTGIKGLDQAIDSLRPGDTVTWQMENIGDYMYVATQFVVDEALTGRPMVYLRFGDHDELIPTEVLQARGARIKKITLDPSVGFETFAVQVHRIISSEPENTFFLFDCLSELQRYWFSDLMICNFFCLTSEFIASRGALCYVALQYERHIYVEDPARHKCPHEHPDDGRLHVYSSGEGRGTGQQVHVLPPSYSRLAVRNCHFQQRDLCYF